MKKKTQKQPVHTVVILADGSVLPVPGCHYIGPETPSGCRYLMTRRDGITLMVVPRDVVILTNWTHPDHA